jgi:hypothetical protein
MTPTGIAIQNHLREVERQRAVREDDPALAHRVEAVKRYQQARFARTYDDLLKHNRYGGPARFFLDDLYGPHDFAQRDAQFSRIVPALVRLFPHEIVETVAALVELHALSETLDTDMGRHLADVPLDRPTYVQAWQRTGRAADRERQIVLTMDVGRALDRYTRNPLLRHSLRVMRGPSRAAGLRELQSFLERGFDTFGAMRGATDFLGTIADRERALARRLFEADAVAVATLAANQADPLGQLP